MWCSNSALPAPWNTDLQRRLSEWQSGRIGIWTIVNSSNSLKECKDKWKKRETWQYLHTVQNSENMPRHSFHSFARATVFDHTKLCNIRYRNETGTSSRIKIFCTSFSDQSLHPWVMQYWSSDKKKTSIVLLNLHTGIQGSSSTAS